MLSLSKPQFFLVEIWHTDSKIYTELQMIEDIQNNFEKEAKSWKTYLTSRLTIKLQ